MCYFLTVEMIASDILTPEVTSMSVHAATFLTIAVLWAVINYSNLEIVVPNSPDIYCIEYCLRSHVNVTYINTYYIFRF